jgi:hypothetical protein
MADPAAPAKKKVDAATAAKITRAKLKWGGLLTTAVEENEVLQGLKEAERELLVKQAHIAAIAEAAVEKGEAAAQELFDKQVAEYVKAAKKKIPMTAEEKAKFEAARQKAAKAAGEARKAALVAEGVIAPENASKVRKEGEKVFNSAGKELKGDARRLALAIKAEEKRQAEAAARIEKMREEAAKKAAQEQENEVRGRNMKNLKEQALALEDQAAKNIQAEYKLAKLPGDDSWKVQGLALARVRNRGMTAKMFKERCDWATTYCRATRKSTASREAAKRKKSALRKGAAAAPPPPAPASASASASGSPSGSPNGSA